MISKTKLTPFVRKKLVELITMGVPEGRAANAIGVTPQTFIRWKHRGENPTDPDNGDSIFVNLVNDLAEAEAKFIKRNVERIDKSADKNSEDAKWLLERRDPGEFGKREVLEIGPSKVLLALQDNARRALNTSIQIDTPKTDSQVLPESTEGIVSTIEDLS